jgi:rhodanese-related sulfurtransferase
VRRTVEELLVEARRRIARYSPAEAYAALEAGALLVDTRSSDERAQHGIVPGSLHVPRTVLEWRLDPDSPWRNPHADGRTDREVILLCAHGYSSSLAAATLVDLGFERAGDVAGGFVAWRAAGLPVAPAPRPALGLPGSGPPDG